MIPDVANALGEASFGDCSVGPSDSYSYEPVGHPSARAPPLGTGFMTGRCILSCPLRQQTMAKRSGVSAIRRLSGLIPRCYVVTMGVTAGMTAPGNEPRAVSFKATKRSARPRGVAEMTLAGAHRVLPIGFNGRNIDGRIHCGREARQR